MGSIESSIASLGSILIVFFLVYIGLYTWAKQGNSQTSNEFRNFLGKNLESFLTVIFYLIGIFLFFIMTAWMSSYTYSAMQDIKGVSANTEGFQNEDVWQSSKSLYNELINSLAPSERYLINLQPLTAYYAGFVGPMEKGEFKPADYIRRALQAGIRAFVLPISRYIDDNKREPNWPPSGSPSISFRNDKGEITSMNGMSVRDFVRALVMNLQENVGQANEPVILYLMQDIKVPDAIDDEQLYVTFMHDIAKDLKDLDSVRLVSAGQKGSAVGGQAERAILMEIPLQDLKGKVLIATNFKTSIALKDKYKSMSPSLHAYTNFVLQPMSGGSEQQGGIPNIVKNSGSVNAANLLLSLSDVIGSKVPWADQSRTIWHAAILNNPYSTPPISSVEEATKKGIQSIAIPFFYTSQEDQAIQKSIWLSWKGFAWKVKEKDARFAKPEPVVVKPADPRVSAVSAPGLKQGQISV